VPVHAADQHVVLDITKRANSIEVLRRSDISFIEEMISTGQAYLLQLVGQSPFTSNILFVNMELMVVTTNRNFYTHTNERVKHNA
jgi:hypothetical protein